MIRQTEVCIKLFETFFARQITAFMSIMLVGGMMFLYVTITLQRYLPILLYIYFPSVSFVILFVIQSFIPELIKIYRISKNLLRLINLQTCHPRLTTKDRKISRRLLKSLRPVQINVGLIGFTLFYFKETTKVTFYSAIVSYTMTLLLAFPAKKLAVYYP